MITMTVLEILKQKLPPDYVVAIIANMQEKDMLDEETCGSIALELEDLFNWEESNEGLAFWMDVAEAISHGSPLPNLPFLANWKPNTYVCMEDGSYVMNVNNTGMDIIIEVDISEKPKNWSEKFFREQHLAFVN